MMVTDLRCWWQNHYVDDFFSLCWWFSQCIKSVTNISNLSPTHLVYNIRHQHQCNRQILRFEWLQKIFYHQPLVIANDKTWKFRRFNLINSFVVDVTGFFSRCFDLAVKCKISQDVNTWTGNYRVVGKGSWNNEKLESFKLKSTTWKWIEWSWKVRSEVGKFGLKLESLGCELQRNIPSSPSSFQL